MSFQMITLAQAASGGGGGGNPLGFLPMMVILLAIMYFMMIRPQRRREAERKKMLENVKSGDKVLFSGGIIGTVANVKEHTLVIKIADKVKIEAARGAVSKVLDKGEKIDESGDTK